MLYRVAFICVFSLILLSGCRTIEPSFIALVNDNAQVVHETNAALLASIDSALKEQMPSADREKLLALKERLEWETRSSVAIRDYINKEQDLSPEVLKELIRIQFEKTLPEQ